MTATGQDQTANSPSLEDLAGPAEAWNLVTKGPGPEGALPLTADMLRHSPSGDLFGWTQDVGMGWKPGELNRPEYLLLSTAGGLRGENGEPIALGYHTGHWEVALQVRAAAEEIRALGGIPFAAAVTDPCDGRTQGTPGMMDSLPFRNDAALVLRRLVRSLPTRKGLLGVATCDKGLPAMLLALSAFGDLPAILVPGGVTLPAENAEDAGKVQTIGARFSQGLITLQEAAEMGCRACGSPGGGCQFLGTAATSQVVAEALGLSLPHAALAPSGQPVWLEMARASARALSNLRKQGIHTRHILTPGALKNALAVHAAFGGSTNLLLHIPAIAFSAGLQRPTVEDWIGINRAVPRLVDALPNGPSGHTTVRVFMAGGVPEVMLHLRDLGLLDLTVKTVTGQTLDQVLDWWKGSARRAAMREMLVRKDGINPDQVIYSPEAARKAGLTSTVVFPTGNLAPEGSVIKATAIDPKMVGPDGFYRHTGPARVFVTERAAIEAVKNGAVKAGDTLVLICRGPLGSGMEETYQITSALKHLPWGKQVALITDARFSGVSTGACIGHVGPEALAGGPVGKLLDGDLIQIIIDTRGLVGTVNLVAQAGDPADQTSIDRGNQLLSARKPRIDLACDPLLPDDTRLWALLQQASGGTWGGCVYDVDAIARKLNS